MYRCVLYTYLYEHMSPLSYSITIIDIYLLDLELKEFVTHNPNQSQQNHF